MKFLFTNNARGTLKLALAALDTALTLDAGQGALFPAPGAAEAFRASVIDTLGNIEIVECTTRVADGMTAITRGKEGTTPRAFAIGSRVSLRVTKEVLESLRDGGNLGTMAQQNANNVAITGGTIGGQTIGSTSGAPLPRSYLAGFKLANNGADLVNDIDIAAGSCIDKDNTANIALGATLTKQLDAVWAVGTNQGMRASGAAIANGTYHIFAIYRPDTNVTDIAADTDATGANVVANTNAAYTKRRRIGSILREAGSIVAFVQDGDTFRRKASVLDVDADNPGAAAVLAALSVPAGLRVLALINIEMSVAAGATRSSTIQISDPSANDEAPSDTVAPLGLMTPQWNNAAPTDIHLTTRLTEWTDTTRQIRYRVSSSAAGDKVRIATLGWFDRRGRDD